MKKLIKFTSVVLSLIFCAVFVLIGIGDVYIPDEITVYDNSEIRLLKVFSVETGERAVTTAAARGTPAVKGSVKLFGIFPAGEIDTVEKQRKYVDVSGEIIGIRMYTEGLLIIGVDTVETAGGSVCPGGDCGLLEGDIILEINDEIVCSSADFSNVISGCGGKDVSLTVKREDEILYFSMTPVYSEAEKKYRCGLWLRDSTAGIGTLTFCDSETGMFASLGHAVCDTDTEEILPVGSGDILTAEITGYTMGQKGTTGQIKGNFSEEVIGTLYDNNEFGVYGTYSNAESLIHETYPVASQNEIETGHAQIISTVDSSGPQYYDIEIEKITSGKEKEARSMTIKITDQDLLDKTGGIIQGMSGSPIIQNGMLVGAVTHVFLNDPTMGYGVFAETMVSEEERIFSLFSQ